MGTTSLLTFALTIAVATAFPGPTVAALVARVVGRGARGVPAFCLGLIAADLVWFASAVFGLAVLAQTAQPIFAAAKYAGAAYLLWLAYRMWTAPVDRPGHTGAPRGEGWRLFAGGVALGLGNPKTMMFYVALTPIFVDVAGLDTVGFTLLSAILAVVYGAVLTSYVLLAARARLMVQDTRVIRTINRASGGVMAGAAVAVATR